MSDLIRRSDAIKAVNPSFMSGLAKKIEAIPSVEPKRSEWQYVYKGKWMFRRCSCCEWAQTYDDSKYMGYRYNFCPHCGADMREREGE